MRRESDSGCIDCGGALGCLIGFGGGIWTSVYVGEAIVSAMPNAHAAAIILAIIAGLSITPLAAGIGNCAGKCLGVGGECCCIITSMKK